MDTDEHFYYVANNVQLGISGNLMLIGTDFEGGLNSHITTHSSRPAWFVNCKDRYQINGSIEIFHRSQVGSRPEIVNQKIPTLPFSLTTDPHVHWVFSGGVSVFVDGKQNDEIDLSINGIPLIGKEWFGILQRSNNGLQIEVYSTGKAFKAGAAYCPDWSEGFDGSLFVQLLAN